MHFPTVTRAELQEMPKFNSHCHLGGEIPLEVLHAHASDHQKEALKTILEEISKTTDYRNGFPIFGIIKNVIDTHAKLKEGTIATCKRMQEDNNQLVLLRTGLKPLENKPHEEYLKTVLAGIEEAAKPNFSVFLMLSLQRSSTVEMAEMTVSLALKYREKGVIGIDISDLSTDGDIRPILPILKKGKDEGLKIAVHMGEQKGETDQMLIINELQPDLIDHGVLLCREARKWVKENQIPVTVCPTSAEAMRMHTVDTLHPWIRRNQKNRHPIHLGTDDATVFGNITLTSEFCKLAELKASTLNPQKITELAQESFQTAEKFLGVKRQ